MAFLAILMGLIGHAKDSHLSLSFILKMIVNTEVAASAPMTLTATKNSALLGSIPKMAKVKIWSKVTMGLANMVLAAVINMPPTTMATDKPKCFDPPLTHPKITFTRMKVLMNSANTWPTFFVFSETLRMAGRS